MNALKSTVLYLIVALVMAVMSRPLLTMLVHWILINQYDSYLIVYRFISFVFTVVEVGLVYILLKRTLQQWPVLKLWLGVWVTVFVWNLVFGFLVNTMGIGYISGTMIITTLITLVNIIVYVVMLKSFRVHQHIVAPILVLIVIAVFSLGARFTSSFFQPTYFFDVFRYGRVIVVAWFIYQVLFTFDALEQEPVSEFEIDEDQYKFDEDFRY